MKRSDSAQESPSRAWEQGLQVTSRESGVSNMGDDIGVLH